MNIFKKNNSQIDKAVAEEIAGRLNLPAVFVELLFLRGLGDFEKITKYLFSKQNEFHNPFDFATMQAVVDRLRQAANNSEKVVVYCDYDADGICAGAILSLFLTSVGAQVFTYVPSRSGDGYGLHIDPLDRIIEEHCPDLILTCDCGISCTAEVEHVLDLGVDIIVTDHHEVPETLPKCVILNPHVSGCGYPFESLCGAGVALKIVQAYLGEKAAEQYLDMAAIATVADLVPLMDENRLIVQRGLEQIKKRTNLGITRLLKRLDMKEITSTDIAFKIAPRINAAGRMGDASRALRLLISDDIAEIDGILDEIEADNNLRKEVCDQLYNEAIADLGFEDLSSSRSIVLSYPDWEKGITGIVAARLAGDFKRPTFIMVKSGDHYKGAARGISGISVHKILVQAAHLFIEYGGHEQAAGFSITEENIAEFKRLVEEYLSGFGDEYFLPSHGYDIEVSESQINREFVKAIELMEPFGHGNPRPLLMIDTTVDSVTPCKNSPAHTQVVAGAKLNLIAFNFAKKNQILLGGGNKKLIIEAQIGTFGGVRGILKQAYGDTVYINDDLAKAGFIRLLSMESHKSDKKADGKSQQKEPQKYNISQLADIVGGNIFGTLIIAGSSKTYQQAKPKLGKNVVLHEFVYSTTKNNYSRVIISPDFDGDLLLPLYKKIIFLDAPLGEGVLRFLQSQTKAEIFVPDTQNDGEFLDGISADRQVFADYYEAMRKNPIAAPSLYSYFFALSKRANLKISQLTVCYSVFCELGLLEQSKSQGVFLEINKGKRVELTDSRIYNLILDKITKCN